MKLQHWFNGRLWLLLIATLLFSSTAPLQAGQAQPLAPFTARYSLSNEQVADALETKISFSHEKEHWFYRTESKAVGAAVLLATMFGYGDPIHAETELEWFKGKLRPLHYHTDLKNANADSQFDWNKSELRVNYKGKVRTLPLKAGTFDHNSVVLLAMQRLSQGPFKTFSVEINENGTRRQLTFHNDGEENVKVPYGSFKAIKVRQTLNPGSQIMTSWFAPKLGYLPVRIMQKDGGKLVADMKMIALPKPIQQQASQ